ncbi:hypothetical protein NQ317_018019 [Molorchus minor]|uniref:Uncharacterized protein n=1 Tax=Molorchus minor TaxID=1323400 RepID=A0ABQ9JTP9_9CUCU|nr:hypothetical protein NQ317_018019 [Molorchus minor]
MNLLSAEMVIARAKDSPPGYYYHLHVSNEHLYSMNGAIKPIGSKHCATVDNIIRFIHSGTPKLKLNESVSGFHCIPNIFISVLKMTVFDNRSSAVSQMAYGLINWGHAPQTSRIFGLQRKAIRIITNLGYREDVKHFYISFTIYIHMLTIHSCKLNHRNPDLISRNNVKHFRAIYRKAIADAKRTTHDEYVKKYHITSLRNMEVNKKPPAIKFLGVYLDSKLTWEEHGLFRTFTTAVDNNTMLPFCTLLTADEQGVATIALTSELGIIFESPP